VYLSVMITRLMLSLKKAATSQENGWSFGEPTTHTTMRFAERRGGVPARDEIHLDTFASTQAEIRSRRDEMKDAARDSTSSLHGALEDLAT